MCVFVFWLSVVFLHYVLGSIPEVHVVNGSQLKLQVRKITLYCNICCYKIVRSHCVNNQGWLHKRARVRIVHILSVAWWKNYTAFYLMCSTCDQLCIYIFLKEQINTDIDFESINWFENDVTVHSKIMSQCTIDDVIMKSWCHNAQLMMS